MSNSLPSFVFADNQACIAMTKNGVNSQKIEYSALKLHFLQEKTDEKVLEVKFFPTENIRADILTKALERVKFQRFNRKKAGDISTQRKS